MTSRMKIRLNERSLTNVAFLAWIVTEFVFLHTIYSQLALILFVGAEVFEIVTERKFYYSFVFFLYILFIGVCMMNIMLGYSLAPGESKSLLKTIILNFIFVIAAYNYLKRRTFSTILLIMMRSAIIVSFVTWFMNFLLTKSLVFRTGGGINGNGMAILNAFVIAMVITSNNFNFYGVRTSILLLFCFVSGTRKAILIVLIVMLLYYCVKNPKKLPKYLLVGTVALVVLYILVMKIPILYNSIGNRVESMLTFLSGGEGDASIISRTSYIQLGMKFFYSSPIWGNGINCFRTLEGAFGTYSHNNYVELLFSVGLCGTIVFYSMYVYIIILSFRKIKYSKGASCLSISIIFACLVTDYAQVVYYDRSSLIIIFLALSLIGKQLININ